MHETNMGASGMRNLKVDVFSDPVCPWCLVGLARLDQAVSALADDVKVTIEHHPFFLDPNAPIKGEDVVAMLKRKYGRDPFEMWDRIELEARASGVELDMRKQKTRHASQPAQALIGAAGAKGTQHELAKAIGNACYLEGLNIADPQVLVHLATAHGFDADEAHAIVVDKGRWRSIEQAAASAAGQGIQGVPFFIFENKYALSGCQPLEVFTQVLNTVLEQADQTGR